MLEGWVADTFWIREKSGILVKKRKERIVRIKNNGNEGKATLEVMSPTDVSNITFHQVLDCSKCLLMSDIKSLRSGRLALVPSLAFDKHMSRGLVLEHRDHHALQEWEGRLRRHLRGKKYLFSFHLHYYPVFRTNIATILFINSRWNALFWQIHSVILLFG